MSDIGDVNSVSLFLASVGRSFICFTTIVSSFLSAVNYFLTYVLLFILLINHLFLLRLSIGPCVCLFCPPFHPSPSQPIICRAAATAGAILSFSVSLLKPRPNYLVINLLVFTWRVWTSKWTQRYTAAIVTPLRTPQGIESAASGIHRINQLLQMVHLQFIQSAINIHQPSARQLLHQIPYADYLLRVLPIQKPKIYHRRIEVIIRIPEGNKRGNPIS